MSESRVVPPLRIAVLGDFDGLHTRRWIEVFVERGHDVHAISYYEPAAQMPGVVVHSLKPRPDFGGWTGPPPCRHPYIDLSPLAERIPPSIMRWVHSQRYLRAGLKGVLDDIAPDVFHAHYAVEHGFYGSFAGFHPYVVSAWGSDLLVESRKTFGRMIAKRALGAADLVTANDASLAVRARELGVPEDRVEVVHLGVDRLFLDAGERSVNLQANEAVAPTVISDRALEPLYNVDVVLKAFARLRDRLPRGLLIVAGDGSQAGVLRGLAETLKLGSAVQFVGRQTPERLAQLLTTAHVYVSVPWSDSLALSTVEAMAAGCFPVVSDLLSADGWIAHGVDGLRVPARDEAALADALYAALTDAQLRLGAVGPNRAKVEAEGLRERNMLLMERHYYRLAGHPQAGGGEAI